MGVSWVLETRDSAHSVELAIERAGGVLQGAPRTLRVDCIWYRPPTQVAGLGIGNFCLLHHSHYPESSFIIGTPAVAGDSPGRATADQGFDLILSKLSSGLVPEHSTRLELWGNEYHLKDFRLRVGAVSSTASVATGVRGVVVEIEFAASNVPSQCMALLSEAVEHFFPGQTARKPEVLQRHTQPAPYAPIDTLQQYLEIFSTMRKKA